MPLSGLLGLPPINAFSKLDVTAMWGDGKTAAADGSQIDTWEDNLLAETSIRYGGYGGIAYRHVSNTYIALFSHFIPCGVWEAVYIIEGLLKNASDIQPDTIHADTQGQSLPVFGLAALLGFDLLPRIRNWHNLVFYRPDEGTRYQHIDSLFGDKSVDWDLIEAHWSDLLRTAISIRENRMSSVTLLRRLGNHSRKNRLYRAFRELGRAIRTITLLRYLSEPPLREQITQVTNRNEAFHGFADWLMFGGNLIGHNDPDYQEKVVKFTSCSPTASCTPPPATSPTQPTTSPPRASGSTPPTWPRSRLTSPTPSADSGTGPSTSPRPTARPPPGWTWSPGCCSRRPRPKLSPTADADSPPHQPESETCSGWRGPFLPYSGRTSSRPAQQHAPRYRSPPRTAAPRRASAGRPPARSHRSATTSHPSRPHGLSRRQGLR